MRLSATVIVSPVIITTRLCRSVVALPPAAPRPPSHHATAASIPDPPPFLEPYEPSFLDHVLLAVFRWTLQQHSQGPRSDLAGFEGMVEELMEFRRVYGLDEQERVSYQTMVALAGPVPWIYRHLFSSQEWSPAVLAWFAQHLLSFLVGEMELTERQQQDDPRAGGVLVHRCRVLEGTNCKGVCAKMCKLPTQRFFAQEWGVPLSMTPNFETGQCQLAFGVVPIPVEDDPTIPEGCLTRCPAFSVPEQREGTPKQTRTADVC